ncbi:MAG TPA: hypothetical protein GX714_11320 [Chloroflexi bacterium]|jgi:hypothetical protein|nr:hypothetical protein [Chloroflexota bacterium]
MAKKRDKIRRRREVTRARQGTERPERKPSRVPVARKEEQTTMKDVWIALGIVVAVVLLFVALYQFAVRQPPSRAEPQEPATEAPETSPGISRRRW